MTYDCIIVGGGLAGMQAGIQLGRYDAHKVLVVDSEDGRSTLCRRYRNFLGYPNGVSGEELRRAGRRQLNEYGIRVARDTILAAEHAGSGDDAAGGFRLRGAQGAVYETRAMLLATGVMDRLPDWPGLRPCLGLTVFVCPDCDGFEIRGRETLVLGRGDVGAEMALTLSQWTKRLLYLRQEDETHPLGPELAERLAAAGIEHRAAPVRAIRAAGDGVFQTAVLQDGTEVAADRAFVAFGGNEVRSGLAEQLGARMHPNRHVWTDPRTKQTTVPGLWAAGDIAFHSEQATVAMGEGAQAAIWIHKSLSEIMEKERH
ncbi:NAD(P)/FAD-dependent oxidoreductase [Paenibacillus sp. MWE-103]|uniref:NAD(P)/FAD-dependent oxidoreductase n=1 Tax=Paenibacillus artemisiicola TaxID=1172618 RepID=A0ABS3WKG4_9BACL|nr:NAD(P)/FAD-dependent oxidoreductase [Paenibacillus artemisiicola]MBO7748785.1 NAD(P)/FAD-dependent oxidoreductase [Paenibacillus artemisiicola]